MEPEYQGYRNHVYRMVHFCFALKSRSKEEREKIIIPAAFHDIASWKEDTVNYIPPSVPPAMRYLKSRGLEGWSKQIALMLTEHHKMRECRNSEYQPVELFRKGDLVDFLFGTFRFGIPKTYVEKVKARFSNANSHENLGQRAWKWFLRNPLNSAPMMKW